jgi:hypothetical protein
LTTASSPKLARYQKKCHHTKIKKDKIEEKNHNTFRLSISLATRSAAIFSLAFLFFKTDSGVTFLAGAAGALHG